MRHTLKIALSTFAATAVFSTPLMHAQSTTGTIYGTVADPSGAAVPNCTVKAVNTATGVAQTTITNGSGAYTFATVDPGDYSVSTTAAGFKNLTQTGIQVSSNQNVHVTFALPIGNTTEEVNVVAGVTMVDTREAQIASTIEQRELQQLPSVNRDVYSLVTTVPGVTHYNPAPLTGDLDGTSFSVNGLPSNMVSFYLDGAFNNVYKDGSAGNAVPNPDALQEVHVVTSNFDAEFGRTPAAVVNVITRSGTKNFHGEAYDYLRNDMFDAKNYFSPKRHSVESRTSLEAISAVPFCRMEELSSFWITRAPLFIHQQTLRQRRSSRPQRWSAPATSVKARCSQTLAATA